MKSPFHFGIHTMLISPRRWGKSSLVKQTAAHLAKNKDYNEQEFNTIMELLAEVASSGEGL